jgi:hypothetical protein
VRREKILDREPQRFEDRDLTVILSGWQFAELRRDMVCRPKPLGDSHHHIARLLKSGFSGIDD